MSQMESEADFIGRHVHKQQEKMSDLRKDSLDDLDKDLLNNQSPPSGMTPTREGSEIEIDLFNRLLKTGVMKASPMIKTLHDKKKVVLDLKNTENYINGVAFAHYLLVLKHVLSKVN